MLPHRPRQHFGSRVIALREHDGSRINAQFHGAFLRLLAASLGKLRNAPAQRNQDPAMAAGEQALQRLPQHDGRPHHDGWNLVAARIPADEQGAQLILDRPGSEHLGAPLHHHRVRFREAQQIVPRAMWLAGVHERHRAVHHLPAFRAQQIENVREHLHAGLAFRAQRQRGDKQQPSRS